MSERVEQKLVKMVGVFMANGAKKTRIGRETLYLPVSKGGLNLLDVKARNEALDILHLKEYMTMNESRPRWTIVADAIFAEATAASSRNVDNLAKVNAFLQSWKTSTHQTAGLGRDLARIVKVAKKYSAALVPLNVTERFKEQLPIWYHLGETEGRSLANTVSAKCLHDRHDVITMCGNGSQTRWKAGCDVEALEPGDRG
ncbi:hypothetical protein C8T65DRAFT_710193 [Cerioporus squamosus]|nr:hypothetical protein C8T65DRAFT_710193 [Cerioporus squamosus]